MKNELIGKKFRRPLKPKVKVIDTMILFCPPMKINFNLVVCKAKDGKIFAVEEEEFLDYYDEVLSGKS